MRLPKKSRGGNVLGANWQQMCLLPAMKTLNLGSGKMNKHTGASGHPPLSTLLAMWRAQHSQRSSQGKLRRILPSWQCSTFLLAPRVPSSERKALMIDIVWLRKSWRKFCLCFYLSPLVSNWLMGTHAQEPYTEGIKAARTRRKKQRLVERTEAPTPSKGDRKVFKVPFRQPLQLGVIDSIPPKAKPPPPKWSIIFENYHSSCLWDVSTQSGLKTSILGRPLLPCLSRE